MKLGDKQTVLVKFAMSNGNAITKKQAVELLEKYYYYNAGHYVGEILSRLVKSKCLKRVKPGVFELLTTVPIGGAVTNNEDQIKLF